MKKLIIVLLLLSCPPLWATYYPTAQELQTNCLQADLARQGKSYSSSKAKWCLGFLQGFESCHQLAAVMQLEKAYKGQRIPKRLKLNHLPEYQFYCLPADVSVGHTIRVVLAYLDGHPKELKKSAALVTYKALLSAYPCRQHA